jgi:2'-5' RNA ligase
VLWIGTEEQPEILGLAERLAAALERAGFEREERPFRPHLTLGRVRHGAGIHDAVAELEKNRDMAFGEMTVRRITLFRSILKPTGAEYSILGESALP